MHEVATTNEANSEPPYRLRMGSEADAAALSAGIGTSLSHPEGKGRRSGYRAAGQREELLILERYDGRRRSWQACAFIDWHMRVDDVLTIRDVGTEGERPHPGMVKQLLLELFRSLSPIEATAKVRTDAGDWNEILASVGFSVEGSEYRRPHWFNIRKWTRQAPGRPLRGGPGRAVGQRRG